MEKLMENVKEVLGKGKKEARKLKEKLNQDKKLRFFVLGVTAFSNIFVAIALMAYLNKEDQEEEI